MRSGGIPCLRKLKLQPLRKLLFRELIPSNKGEGERKKEMEKDWQSGTYVLFNTTTVLDNHSLAVNL